MMRFLDRDASVDELRTACFDNHMAWLRRLAEAGGGRVFADECVEWTVTRRPYAEVTVAVTDPTQRAVRAQIDSIAAYCRENRVEALSFWAADEAQTAALSVWLAARGQQPCDSPNWMGLDLRGDHSDAASPEGHTRFLSQASRNSTITMTMPDRLDEWTVPELLCYHPVGKHIRQAMLAGQPRRVWHAVLWQEGRPVGNMSVNATDGARGVVGLHDLFVLPSAGVTGLGLDLFDGALGFVSDLGCRYVVTNAGEGAAALFEAGGFRPLGRGATWSLPHHALRLQFEEDQVWLAEAVGEGDIDAMAALVARADDGVLDRPLANGLRPLRFAAAHGRDDSARWLLARGARPDLLAAWDLGWRDEARELLERDATLARTHRSHSGKTLLHVAAERDDPDLATLLLHHGADPAARDGRFDGTPLEWAEELGRLRVAEVLRRAPG